MIPLLLLSLIQALIFLVSSSKAQSYESFSVDGGQSFHSTGMIPASEEGGLQLFFKIQTVSVTNAGDMVITFIDTENPLNICNCNNVAVNTFNTTNPYQYNVTCTTGPCKTLATVNPLPILRTYVSMKRGGSELIDQDDKYVQVLFRQTIDDPVFVGSTTPLVSPGDELELLVSMPNKYAVKKEMISVFISTLPPLAPAELECEVIDSPNMGEIVQISRSLLYPENNVFVDPSTLQITTINPLLSDSNQYVDKGTLGLITRHPFRKLKCLVPSGLSDGRHNIRMEHQGFGKMATSRYMMSFFVNIFGPSTTLYEPYMIRSVTRIDQILQSKISPLGGYIEMVGTFDATSDYSIEYRGTVCRVVEKKLRYRKCALGHLTPPSSQKYFPGNQGVTVKRKLCSIDTYKDLSEENPFDPALYPKTDRLSTLFEARDSSSGHCVRYLSMLNFHRTLRLSLGSVCAPEFCSIHISAGQDSPKQYTNFKKTTQKGFFEDFFRNSTTYFNPNFYSFRDSLDYLLDFQRLEEGFQSSSFAYMPIKIARGDLKKKLTSSNLLNIFPVLQVDLKCTLPMELPHISFIMLKMESKIKVQFQTKKDGVLYGQTFVSPFIHLPFDCEKNLDESPLSHFFYEKVGYHGAYCQMSYSAATKVINKRFNYNNPGTSHMIVTFYFPFLEYEDITTDLTWEATIVAQLPAPAPATEETLIPFVKPVTLKPEVPYSKGSLPFNGWIYFQSSLSNSLYNATISQKPFLEATQLIDILAAETGSQVTLKTYYDPGKGFKMLFYFDRQVEIPTFQVKLTGLQGCAFKLDGEYYGSSNVIFTIISQGNNDLTFRAPPPELFRTVHITPQLTIKSESGLYQQCDNCDLAVYLETEIPRVTNVEVSFEKCQIKCTVEHPANFFDATPLSFHKLSGKYILEGQTFHTSTSELSVTDFKKETAPLNTATIEVDLEQFVTISSNSRIDINPNTLVFEYLGVGILENHFQSFVDNSLKVTDLQPSYTTLDRITSFFEATALDGSAILPADHTTHFDVTYKVFEIDVSHHLSQPQQAGVIQGGDQVAKLIVDPTTLFFDNAITDFYSPRRYRITYTLVRKNSKCHRIEKVFEVDFKHEIISFVLTLEKESFLVKDDLEARIESFSLQPANFNIESYTIYLKKPAVINNQMGQDLGPETSISVSNGALNRLTLNPLRNPIDISEANQLNIPGWYQVRVLAIFGDETNLPSQVAYEYQSSIDFQVVQSEDVLEYKVSSASILYSIDQTIMLESSANLLQTVGTAQIPIRIPWNPLGEIPVSNLKYKISGLKWEIGYSASTGLTGNISSLVEHCNNPPLQSCYLNQHAFPQPSTYEATVFYQETDTESMLTVTKNASLIITVNTSPNIFPAVDFYKSIYYQGEPISFDGSMSINPNLRNTPFFQKFVDPSTNQGGLNFDWQLQELPGLTIIQSASQVSTFQVDSFGLTVGNSFRVTLTLSTANIGPLPLLQPQSEILTFDFLYSAPSTTTLDFFQESLGNDMMMSTLPEASFNFISSLNYKQAYTNIQYGFISGVTPDALSPQRTLNVAGSEVQSLVAASKKYFYPLTVSTDVDGTPNIENKINVPVAQSLESLSVSILPGKDGKEFSTMFTIRTILNFQNTYFTGLTFRIFYTSLDQNSWYLLWEGMSAQDVTSMLPYGNGKIELQVLEKGALVQKVETAPFLVERQSVEQVLAAFSGILADESSEGIEQSHRFSILRMLRDFHLFIAGKDVDLAFFRFLADIPRFHSPHIFHQFLLIANNDLLTRESNLEYVQESMVDFLEQQIEDLLYYQSSSRRNVATLPTIQGIIDEYIRFLELVADTLDIRYEDKMRFLMDLLSRDSLLINKSLTKKSEVFNVKMDEHQATNAVPQVDYSWSTEENGSVELSVPPRGVLIAKHLADKEVTSLAALQVSKLIYQASILDKSPERFIRDAFVVSEILSFEVVMPELKLDNYVHLPIDLEATPIKSVFKISRSKMFKKQRSLDTSSSRLFYRCMHFDQDSLQWSQDSCTTANPTSPPGGPSVFECECTVLGKYAIVAVNLFATLDSKVMRNFEQPMARNATEMTMSEFTKTTMWKYTSSLLTLLVISVISLFLLDSYVMRFNKRGEIVERFQQAIAYFHKKGAKYELFEKIFSASEESAKALIVQKKGGFVVSNTKRKRVAKEALNKLAWMYRYQFIKAKFLNAFNKARMKDDESGRELTSEENQRRINEEIRQDRQAAKVEINDIMKKVIHFDQKNENDYIYMKNYLNSLHEIRRYLSSIFMLAVISVINSHSVFSLFTDYTNTSSRFYRATFVFLRIFIYMWGICLIDEWYDFETLKTQFYLFYFTGVLIVGRLVAFLLRMLLNLLKLWEGDVNFKEPVQTRRLQKAGSLGLDFARTLVVVIIIVALYVYLWSSQLTVSVENRYARVWLHGVILPFEFIVLEIFFAIMQLTLIVQLLSRRLPAWMEKTIIGAINSQVLLAMLEFLSKRHNFDLTDL